MNIYIETYGCRMNICDSQVILSILEQSGHSYCADICHSDVIVLNCCSVREVGHEKTFERLSRIEAMGLANKIIVLAGCYATQLDNSLFGLFPFVDIIIGPDSYRKLPVLLLANKGLHAIVQETLPGEMYADIVPKRYLEDTVTAAITVMKGCNQYCSYCIEPFTRGQEQSREPESVLQECKRIEAEGYKELTLVGHIIDRYHFGFAELLEQVATHCPNLRIKYLSSHPLTYTDQILDVVRRHENIMRVVHLPIQSGSDSVLKRMNRGYTIEQYKARYKSIKKAIPDISIVTDIMVGFCGETDEEHKETLNVVQELEFDDINVFSFSMRHGTAAFKKYNDDVPERIKERRRYEVIALRDIIKLKNHRLLIGKDTIVFNEGLWHNDPGYYFGRDHHMRICIFKTDRAIQINEQIKLRVQSAAADHLLCSCL